MSVICDSFQAAILDTMSETKRLMAMPLNLKIEHSKRTIREFHDHMDGLISVSFSGGLDSTVLLHLIRSMYPDTPAVFFDTGLEYPEIRQFVRTHDNVQFIHPTDKNGNRITFRQVIEQHGYPVIGKEIADAIERARKGNHSGLRHFTGIDVGGGKNGLFPL